MTVQRPQIVSAEPNAAGLGALRRAIRAIERKNPGEESTALSLGPAIDEVLGGGLASGMLHEISAGESEIAAATGFALSLIARRVRPVVWIAEDMALTESGAPYGPGLDDLGLAPERLILVRVPRSRDVPWAMEEALRCRAVGAVIGEVRGPARIDLVATRRLSLAAAHGGAPALLLRAGVDPEPSAAATRWIVVAAPSIPAPHGLGAPRLSLQLTRNRRGHLGSWTLEWNRAEQRYVPALPEPVAETALDRPADKAVA